MRQTELHQRLLATGNGSLVALVKMLTIDNMDKCQQSIDFLQEYTNDNEADELPTWDPLPTWEDLEA